MSEIDFEARQKILTLQDRISELQAMFLLAVSETKVLAELSIVIWEYQKVIGWIFLTLLPRCENSILICCFLLLPMEI